jgi:hypothetical protein
MIEGRVCQGVVPRQRRCGSPGRRSSKHSCVRPQCASRSGTRARSGGASDRPRREGHSGRASCRTMAWFRCVRERVRRQSPGPAVIGRVSRAGAVGIIPRWPGRMSIRLKPWIAILAIRSAVVTAIGLVRLWRAAALGSCCWKASFRLLGIRVKARRFVRNSRSASSPGDPAEGLDARRVVAVRREWARGSPAATGRSRGANCRTMTSCRRVRERVRSPAAQSGGWRRVEARKWFTKCVSFWVVLLEGVVAADGGFV